MVLVTFASEFFLSDINHNWTYFQVNSSLCLNKMLIIAENTNRSTNVFEKVLFSGYTILKFL